MNVSIPKTVVGAMVVAALWCGSSPSARADYASNVMALNPVVYYQLNEAPAVVPTYWATNLGSAGALANGVYLGTNADNGVSDFSEPYFPGAILSDTNVIAALFTGNGAYSTGVSIPQHEYKSGSGLFGGMLGQFHRVHLRRVAGSIISFRPAVLPRSAKGSQRFTRLLRSTLRRAITTFCPSVISATTIR